MSELPKHTSAAQLALYASCPRKYRYRYLQQAEPEYKSVSLALGAAVHSAIGWWFEQKQSEQTPTLQEVDAVVRADLTAMTNEATRYGRWTHEDLERHAEQLVRCFLDRHGDLPVKEIESRFELDLFDVETGEVLPRKLIGYLDFLLNDGRVIELKTARSEYTAVDIAANIQFGAYRHALRQLDLGSELVLAVIIKNKRPRLQQVVLRPDPGTERRFLQTAVGIERAIHAGHFHRAPGQQCGGCEFQHRCLGLPEVIRDQAA
jgi:hypothetical protein